MMDAMVKFAFKRYTNATNQQELRNTLAKIFMDDRYRLVDALTMQFTATNDPLRH
jgi:hypothetical protein